MASKSADPWYVHAAFYVIIVVLVYLLIQVAIIEPKSVVQTEKYNRSEARLRMMNLREAEILWQKKHGSFTDNLDELILFLHSPWVDSVRNSIDSLTRRSADNFVKLSHGEFTPDSLYRTPRSQQNFIISIDTTMQIDTVVTPRGRLLRVDTTIMIGTRYLIEDPDGYGTIGSIDSDAMKNTASWE